MNEQQGEQLPQQDTHRTRRAVLLAVIILVLAAAIFLSQRPKIGSQEQMEQDDTATVDKMQETEPTGNIDDVIKALESDADAEGAVIEGFDDSDALLQDSDIINSYNEEIEI